MTAEEVDGILPKQTKLPSGGLIGGVLFWRIRYLESGILVRFQGVGNQTVVTSILDSRNDDHFSFRRSYEPVSLQIAVVLQSPGQARHPIRHGGIAAQQFLAMSSSDAFLHDPVRSFPVGDLRDLLVDAIAACAGLAAVGCLVFFLCESWNKWLAVLITATTVLDYLIARGMEVGRHASAAQAASLA